METPRFPVYARFTRTQFEKAGITDNSVSSLCILYWPLRRRRVYETGPDAERGGTMNGGPRSVLRQAPFRMRMRSWSGRQALAALRRRIDREYEQECGTVAGPFGSCGQPALELERRAGAVVQAEAVAGRLGG